MTRRNSAWGKSGSELQSRKNPAPGVLVLDARVLNFLSPDICHPSPKPSRHRSRASFDACEFRIHFRNWKKFRAHVHSRPGKVPMSRKRWVDAWQTESSKDNRRVYLNTMSYLWPTHLWRKEFQLVVSETSGNALEMLWREGFSERFQLGITYWEEFDDRKRRDWGPVFFLESYLLAIFV